MRCLCLSALVFALAACGDTEDPGTTSAELGTSSTSADESSSSAVTQSTSISATGATATSTTTTTSSTTAADVSTTDAGDDTSSGSTGCTPGSLDCTCDGDSCDDGLVCTDGVCAPPSACDQDLLEPNDEESMPTLLGEISDDDDDGGSIFGTLDGPDDVDWYRYTGDDDILSNVDPARFVKTSSPLRLCKFAECEGGVDETEFECPAETEPATSPLGRPGCCAPMGIALGDANCTGVLEDNMQVFMRVDQGEAACIAYELIYHY